MKNKIEDILREAIREDGNFIATSTGSDEIQHIYRLADYREDGPCEILTHGSEKYIFRSSGFELFAEIGANGRVSISTASY